MGQSLTLDADWSVGARYQASGTTPVLICNPDFENRSVLRWTTTPDATLPTIGVSDATGVRPGDPQPLELADGEYLWLAGLGETARLEF